MSDVTNLDISSLSIAVLMGGPGAEREVSLRSGAAVARALHSLGCRVEEVDVRGEAFELPAGLDLAYNMIHGTFGEDGQIQEVLDARGISYTGEGARGSRIAFDKILTKECFDRSGVPTCRWEKLLRGERPSLPLPYVVKAPRQGSSVGIHIIRNETELEAALDDALRFGDDVLVEEFCKGMELTVGILGQSALPVIEIAPHGEFYTYETKYTKGGSDYYVPARIPEVDQARVREIALQAFQALDLEVYARVDFLLAPDGTLNVLEINTIPGMTETSLLPKAAACVGTDFPELCAQIARLSLKKRKESP